MGASVYTERSNREQYSEETVTSVTAVGLSRARLGDRFSAYFHFALRAFSTETTGPFGRSGHQRGVFILRLSHPRCARTGGRTSPRPSRRRECRNRRSARPFRRRGCRLRRPEDAEGDEGTTQSVMQSLQVPEVTSLRHSLPTRVMRARICAFAAPRAPCRVAITLIASFYVSVSSPAPDCVTFAARMSLPSLSSDCG